ncbi:MAG: CDP-alcohol phosphatidyltransferase family protein [Desulfurococcales archaeon]|nr:CDP-alcohol phosphatidyltransferase family protein [Desulfurococcales archaeon]
MISRLRKLIKPLSLRVGKWLGRHGIEPNVLTSLGLLISILVPVSVYYSLLVVGLALVILSATLDYLDGAVAKALNKSSSLGAFLDSFSDRVSDFCYSIALWLAGIDALYVMLYIATSYLISYVRARAESLGVKLEGVGLMERGERTLVIIVIFIIIAATESLFIPTYIIIGMIALNVITIIQRVYYTFRGLSRNEQ